jgi:predicted rRNA methylase YqxC with S4 and FtsJ domains
MDLEVLVKNTFAEEKSSAFIENAKKIGVVDDKLNLTTRGYNTLIKTAKYLSIDVQ